MSHSDKARPAASALLNPKLMSSSLRCCLEANSFLGLQVAQSYGLLLGTIVMVPKTAQTLAAIIMLTFILTGGYFVRGNHSYSHPLGHLFVCVHLLIHVRNICRHLGCFVPWGHVPAVLSSFMFKLLFWQLAYDNDINRKRCAALRQSHVCAPKSSVRCCMTVM